MIKRFTLQWIEDADTFQSIIDFLWTINEDDIVHFYVNSYWWVSSWFEILEDELMKLPNKIIFYIWEAYSNGFNILFNIKQKWRENTEFIVLPSSVAIIHITARKMDVADGWIIRWEWYQQVECKHIMSSPKQVAPYFLEWKDKEDYENGYNIFLSAEKLKEIFS